MSSTTSSDPLTPPTPPPLGGKGQRVVFIQHNRLTDSVMFFFHYTLSFWTGSDRIETENWKNRCMDTVLGQIDGSLERV